ncbi:MAG: alpha/beta hydrolase [Bryobacteraceae bacterium]|nr:alpha/beta hydrolase [Bryobacterales bacterium]MEB2360407.1 alpha/beta hydrolase [Bryobacterales bacterium]NUN03757.1 alpha/beta hydrolase [Bryobacteraceae bacterium]
MARRIESLMLPGPVGRLEARLEEPDDEEPVEACLVCHPHPRHGGTMHNKVVHRLARGLRRSGSVVLRFNYRGVNLSEGEYGHGKGELEDARVALKWLRERYPYLPFSLAGFSFGSRIILRLGCSVQTPLRLIAVGFPAGYREKIDLAHCTLRKIFIQSTNDEFGSKNDLEPFVSSLPEPKELYWVQAENHFFRGALDQFEETVFGLKK